MSHRLVYVIGPSGAGKDSVLHALRKIWPAPASALRAHWAPRTITREAQARGEQHETVLPATFNTLRAQNAFGLHWQANGLLYGIRTSELLGPLESGCCVFVNGSRGHLPTLLYQWPEATVVHISAPPQLLAQRLATRGREAPKDILARLHREVALNLPGNHIEICNDGPLEKAANELAKRLDQRLGTAAQKRPRFTSEVR